MGQSPTASEFEPLVAVISSAINEAGTIGRVLDKMPRDGRAAGGRALSTRIHVHAIVAAGATR